ncbi:hypothetical protein CAEBREN_19868 [Caenorhabditis brenneri]|uniref:Uncharacterized protein n=1 Tax=Caenorhabditis brenneri TaxID=135651 RepID=G0NIR2_CAEBE|nr:hypothetical protein CAEBREN_19868 [Caenorhabditis brenneri]
MLLIVYCTTWDLLLQTFSNMLFFFNGKHSKEIGVNQFYNFRKFDILSICSYWFLELSLLIISNFSECPFTCSSGFGTAIMIIRNFKKAISIRQEKGHCVQEHGCSLRSNRKSTAFNATSHCVRSHHIPVPNTTTGATKSVLQLHQCHLLRPLLAMPVEWTTTLPRLRRKLLPVADDVSKMDWESADAN